MRAFFALMGEHFYSFLPPLERIKKGLLIIESRPFLSRIVMVCQ